MGRTMTPTGASAATGHDAKNAGRGDLEDAPRERRYDAFVVRLWHDRTTGRLLRAEVEHAASGECTRAAGPAEAWVLDQIRACLAARLGDDASPPPARPE